MAVDAPDCAPSWSSAASRRRPRPPSRNHRRTRRVPTWRTWRAWSGPKHEPRSRSTPVAARWESTRAHGQAVSLHVRRVVQPPAPAVLLVHGLCVSSSVVQPFARRLLPEFAAVAPDLRGHGQSDAPPDGYTPTEYA